MRRRNFLKRIPIAASAPVVLNSLPINVMAATGELQRLAATSANDKIIVLIQLHGGNDGLNTIIPIEQYAQYYNLRPNIAIAENGTRPYIQLDSSLPVEDQVGLHPDLVGVKSLYDRGRASIVQDVGYENMNGSHFRSRDIWFMGGDYDEYLGSGWMGRYLDHEFPGYPEAYPNATVPHPLAIEVGNSVSLAFHRANGIPAGISIRDPEQFHDLVEQVINGEPPETIENTHYGEELRYILQMEEKTRVYEDVLYGLYNNGSASSFDYPDQYPFNAPNGRLRNPLSGQMEMIARLISGGCQTKIYLAKIGGFDTHADQVESYDASMGNHAALLYHIGSAMEAFQRDLQEKGIEDQVLTMTFSEFGRRAASNGSFGSDHGAAAPMLIFGKHVNPGVFGSNPDLDNLDRGNLPTTFDYRQVFTSVVKDWFEASDEAIEATGFADWVDNRLPLIGDGITSSKVAFFHDRNHLKDCYPNPVSDHVTIDYRINSKQHVKLRIMDAMGREVKVLVDGVKDAGTHSVSADLNSLKPGTYIYEISTELLKTSKKLVKK